MRINDYDLIGPEGSRVGVQLATLARHHPHRTARLIDCLEQFVEADIDQCCKVAEEKSAVYLVPHRHDLAILPDAAALVHVRHSHRRIELAEIIPEYGGPNEPAHWKAAEALARKIAEQE